MELDILVDLLVEQSNLYSQQCGRIFFTNDREMKAFIGVNYFMAINKLPNLQNYWDSDIFIGNEGIRNIMTRNRFKDILQNIYFADNQTSDTTDRAPTYSSFQQCIFGSYV